MAKAGCEPAEAARNLTPGGRSILENRGETGISSAAGAGTKSVPINRLLNTLYQNFFVTLAALRSLFHSS
jgi:hypothetical protein